MKSKNNPHEIEKALKDKKTKLICLLAPSFVAEFDYPYIIYKLREIGFDKIVELTFGAKMINRIYHSILEKNESKKQKERKFYISTVCPGIVDFVKRKYPQYSENLIPVDSPMIATGKICKKFFPKHKTIFISPCNFKKQEAENSKYIDYVLDYTQLNEILKNKEGEVKNLKHQQVFDRFYNDYTKVYPLSGGLSKTAHLIGVLKPGEEKIMDGIIEVDNFLKNIKNYENQKVRFVDVTFCVGGCLGGPCLSKEKSLEQRRERLKNYLEIAKKEKMQAGKMGLIEKAKGIRFEARY
jgi:iron only hydrogenase large subunit-like protein